MSARARQSALLWAFFLLDAALVTAFAAIGRRSHDEADPVAGALDTAWPFLVGLAIGWLIAYFNWSRVIPVSVASGVTVWVSTVCFGMLIRHFTDKGTAFSFIVVASLVLAVFLIGWRAVRHLLASRSAKGP